ncbi:hypothetical protein ABZY29_03415 [Streptomyces coeruleorubidus]
MHENGQRFTRAHALRQFDQVAVCDNRLRGVTALPNVAEGASSSGRPAHHIHARNTRQRALGSVRAVGVLTRDLLDVTEIDTRSLQPDQSLARPRHRIRHIGLHENLGAAEPLVPHGTHN